MTFPRPCLYALLAACLLLPGCVANQYAIKINLSLIHISEPTRLS